MIEAADARHEVVTVDPRSSTRLTVGDAASGRDATRGRIDVQPVAGQRAVVGRAVDAHPRPRPHPHTRTHRGAHFRAVTP